jgi:hypothetical protein
LVDDCCREAWRHGHREQRKHAYRDSLDGPQPGADIGKTAGTRAQDFITITNGGAAIACLGLMGSSSPFANAPEVKWLFAIFLLGLVCAGVTMVRYATNLGLSFREISGKAVRVVEKLNARAGIAIRGKDTLPYWHVLASIPQARKENGLRPDSRYAIS